jgi:uncharacterized protein
MHRGLPILLLTLLAACGRGPGDARALGRDETLVQTSGRAKAETVPNEARFSIGVTALGATGPAASAANARKMEAVVAALRGAGAGERDLQTRELTIERIGYGPNRGRFQANNVVAVRMRQVEQASAAIGAATGAGANVLSGPDLSVGDREAATRGAYANAYRAARARADAYAKAAGLRVVRVMAIRDGATSAPVADYAFEAAQRAPAPVAAPPVLAGTTEEEVSVAADFVLAR